MKIENLEQACEVFNKYKYKYLDYYVNIHKHKMPITNQWKVVDPSNTSISLVLFGENGFVYTERSLDKWEAITLAQALVDQHAKEENL